MIFPNWLWRVSCSCHCAMQVKILAILLLCFSAGYPEDDKTPLVGAWKLVSYTDISPEGKPYFPFGLHPIGEFLYTPDGHFSVDVQSDANGSVPPQLPRPEFDDLMGPFLGYFGTYRFDAVMSTLEYDLDGASAPSYAISDVSRLVRFDGNHLIITGESVRRNGHHWKWERVLEKDSRA